MEDISTISSINDELTTYPNVKNVALENYYASLDIDDASTLVNTFTGVTDLKISISWIPGSRIIPSGVFKSFLNHTFKNIPNSQVLFKVSDHIIAYVAPLLKAVYSTFNEIIQDQQEYGICLDIEVLDNRFNYMMAVKGFAAIVLLSVVIWRKRERRLQYHQALNVHLKAVVLNYKIIKKECYLSVTIWCKKSKWII